MRFIDLPGGAVRRLRVIDDAVLAILYTYIERERSVDTAFGQPFSWLGAV